MAQHKDVTLQVMSGNSKKRKGTAPVPPSAITLPEERGKLESFLKEQIELENRIVQAAQESVQSTANELVRKLIEGIALNSRKHALLLGALLAHLQTRTPFISEEKRDQLESSIQEHIQLEAKVIQTYCSILRPPTPISNKSCNTS